jgi:ribosomal protein S18 acetylase RimI-like enzyme
LWKGIDEMLSARMRNKPLLAVDVRQASADRPFTNRYLTEALWPGIDHPVDRQGLFNTDYASLATAKAMIVLGLVGNEVAAGLYMTVDGIGIAWLHGVRVIPHYRGRRYGTDIVLATLTFLTTNLGHERAALTVRCDDAGIPAAAAFHSYWNVGFRPTGRPFFITVSGDLADRHMGEVGDRIGSLRMDWTGS